VPFALRLAHLIDRINAAIGKAACGLMIALVGLGALTAVLRYIGRPLGVSLTSNAFLEGQWYLFSAVFLLAAAWGLRERAHVRVDVLYGRLSDRGQALIDLAGTLLFLLPFCALMLWATGPSVAESWAVREVSPDPGGLPRYPIKALVPAAFALLLLQGVAQAIKAVARLCGTADRPPLRGGEGV
jgi:TRAP-type mannitol/chloroaromatic compound transport system permease small subunit